MLKWFRRKEKPEETPAEADAPVAETEELVTPEVTESEEAETTKPDPIPAEDPIEPTVAEEPAEVIEAETESEPESKTEEKKKGLFGRLRERLGKTKQSLIGNIRAALRLRGKVDDELLEEIEEILIQSDVGVQTTMKIVERLHREAGRRGELEADAAMDLLRESIDEILTANNRPLAFDAAQPAILLLVGVNGTGKTTTIGKIGKVLTDQGKRVMMVAADTFRAAAAEQLTIWAERTGACIVRREEGADPASVIFEALEGAREDTPDVIMIDTAGRLHTKTALMEELAKLVRVIKRHYPDAPHETILVLDATTGQNALNQVKLFHEACELTGLIMTKLDGTAKGGILIACKDAYGLPIFKIGIGEGVEDLRDFDPEEFVEALFETNGE